MAEFMIVLDGTDEGLVAVQDALSQNNGSIIAVFDPVILIGDGDDTTVTAVSAITPGVRAVGYDHPVDVESLGLDEASAFIASGWNTRFNADYEAEKASRPGDGESWTMLGDCVMNDEEAVA
jgi:hypothetical protein